MSAAAGRRVAPELVRVRDRWGRRHWVRLADLGTGGRVAIVCRLPDGRPRSLGRRTPGAADVLHLVNIAGVESAQGRAQLRRAALELGLRYVTGGQQQREHAAMGLNPAHRWGVLWGVWDVAGGPLDAPAWLPTGGTLDHVATRAGAYD